MILADNEYVIVHGPLFRPWTAAHWIVADLIRVAHGVPGEHWNVL